VIKKNEQFLDIVKHPKVRPTRIEIPIEPERIGLLPKETWSPTVKESAYKMVQGKLDISFRTTVEDYVNIFWLNFAFWSGMLWDPKRFPELTYEVNKKHGAGMKEVFSLLPWHRRLLFKLLMPKNFSKVKDMKKLAKFGQTWEQAYGCIIEYLDQISKIDEHYFRMYENCECWVFQNVGATMAAILPPIFAGVCKGLESWRGLERDWNAVETKCVGLGDPYCEFKLIPEKTDELKGSLVKDVSVIERIHERLMNRLTGFLIDGKPLVERPKLGSNIHIRMIGPVMGIPIMAGKRYQMAWRLGGAKMGKEIGERLVSAGLSEDEAEKRILSFLEHCKVGKVTVDETIKIEENCEPLWIVGYTAKWKEPCCFFTTGFLNGFFSVVKNQHVKETKCIAMGDPYCEWEFK
jgi:predicted hydrocarbon binding protein